VVFLRHSLALLGCNICNFNFRYRDLVFNKGYGETVIATRRQYFGHVKYILRLSNTLLGHYHSEGSIPNLQFPQHNISMFWIAGALTLIVWFVLKILLHKGSGVHIILLFAVSCFVTQFVQDRRTRAYRADR
jgi:hypothetical protein